MRPASLCPQVEDFERVLQRQASPWELEQLACHLEECDRCGEALDGLLTEDGLVTALGTELAPPRDDRDRAAVVRLQTHLRRLWRAAPAPAGPDTPVQGSADNTPPPVSCAPRWGAEPVDFLAPPQADDEIGRLGAYGVLRVLGKGGMGIVFLARQARPRRLVALKMILSAARAGREQLARFRGETELVARLSHPNIVQVHDAGEHDGRPFFTMEYVEGGSLAERLATAPLAAEEAARLVQTLAPAVQHAHERGLVHRDLKPANVLLAPPASGAEALEGARMRSALGTPRISDFGLAKQLEGSPTATGLRTESGAILGTPAYMAPEQAAGDGGAVGPAADVYALGAILYECLTGRPPFRAATLLQTLEQVRTQEPVSLARLQPGVPRDLETICLKCLHKQPERRYVTAQALAEDLGRFLRGEPILGRPVSRRERLWKWARRKPALAALLAVSALSLAVLVAGGLAYDSRLRAALEQARAQEAEARRQQERADTGYRAARAALDQMLRRLQQHRAGEVPGLKELERQQCRDALAFYEGVFAGADDPSPDVRLDAAHAYQRAARIQRLLGRNADAVALFGRAIAMVEALPPQERDLPPTQDLLADCYSDRGMAGSAEAAAERERDLTRALALRAALLQAEPDNAAWQDGLARTEHQLGQVLLHANRTGAARPHSARAAALRTRLVADHPDEEEYQYALAEDHVSLGVLDMMTGDRKGAMASFEKVEELLRPLVRRHPEDVRGALALAAANLNHGYCLADDGQVPKALTRLDQAVELAEAALRREPTHLQTREVARNAHGARAQTCERLGRWAEAVRSWDRVVELDQGPGAWARRVLRASALIRAGDHHRAAAEAAALETTTGLPDDGIYNVACLYALAVGAVRGDTQLPSAEREALAERHAGRALAVLHRLRERGYFKGPAQAEALASDADFEALRGRADFQKLLSETRKGKAR